MWMRAKLGGVRLAAAGLLAVSAVALLPRPGVAGPVGMVTAGGYTFTNFDPSLSGAAVGSNANGISNTGQVVGTAVDANNASTFVNYMGLPASTTALSTGANQVAFGINSAGTVVGGTGTGAFVLHAGGAAQALTGPAVLTNAFGINDLGNIVGQFTTPFGTPGFFMSGIGASANFVAIYAPTGPTTVNAQGINNNGVIVGFYVGADGQDHGFRANLAQAVGDTLQGIGIADPVIPPVAGEPGATFVFSQILGVNDSGIAVGYYGDSTTSQHGFIYDTHTGQYTFLDDPAQAFTNGVEVTQITGIADSGELAGFYTGANGIAHSFAACPVGTTCAVATTTVPEPGSLLVLGGGLLSLGLLARRGRSGGSGV